MTDQAKPTGTAGRAARRGAGRISFRAEIPEKERQPHAKQVLPAPFAWGYAEPQFLGSQYPRNWVQKVGNLSVSVQFSK